MEGWWLEGVSGGIFWVRVSRWSFLKGEWGRVGWSRDLLWVDGNKNRWAFFMGGWSYIVCYW